MIPDLTCSIIYSDNENNAIERLKPFSSGQWDERSGEIKKNVEIVKMKIKEGLASQAKCAYCGALLWDSSNPEIEHIAPKGKYPEFMYTNSNLVYACHLCNGFCRKGTKNTIKTYNKDYEKCVFTIVHPYFHDVKEHYKYKFGDNIYKLIVVPRTKEAENSIEMFGLNDIPRIEARGKRVISESIKLTYEQETEYRKTIEYGHSNKTN